MKTRVLRTYGDGKFVEEEYIKSEPTNTEIEVKAVMTGVCRSDIDMMNGLFPQLPIHMQGHEGLGVVTKVGEQVYNVEVGDFVATRGEPAYADYYNVRRNEFVVVPELDPKYILEPVACGINLVKQASDQIRGKCNEETKCLIVGSGFLAWVAYHTLKLEHFRFGSIEVWGSSNKELWRSTGALIDKPKYSKYDVIIDIREHIAVIEQELLAPNGIWVVAAEKNKFETTLGSLLWNATTIVMPSPRHPGFYDCMQDAKIWVKTNDINVDMFWSRSYNRNTEWQQAFADGVDRPNGYSRGYIKWD